MKKVKKVKKTKKLHKEAFEQATHEVAERQPIAEVPVKKSPRLTLQNLIAEKKEIWVINRGGPETTHTDVGLIVLQVGSGDFLDKIIIPPGKDPVCLTEQATPKLLEECMDLFKMVRAGGLELLDPAQADEYYAENVARKQIVTDKIDQVLKSQRVTSAAPRKAISDSSTTAVNSKVGDICLKAKHSAISEREALEKLMEQEAVLKVDDYKYLSVNGVFSGIKDWAKNKIKTVLDVRGTDPVETSIAQR